MQWIKYLAVAIVSAMISFFAANYYSDKTINALLKQIEDDRRESLLREQEAYKGIAKKDTIINDRKSQNEKLYREILAEKERRSEREKVLKEKEFTIIKDPDSLVAELRKIYN